MAAAPISRCSCRVEDHAGPWYVKVRSRQTLAALEQADKDARLYVFEGEHHAFVPDWPLSMQRTVAFLDRELKA
jgi:hypothetical protein